MSRRAARTARLGLHVVVAFAVVVVLAVWVAFSVSPGVALAGDHQRPAGADRPEAEGVARAVDVPFQTTFTDIGNVGLAFTNFGFFGNNFVDRTPSFEYPLGAAVEHLVRAGVWVGAIRADTGEALVSSATADGFVGDDTDASTEYRPTDDLRRRSVLINDQYFSPDAVSEQDWVTAYADTTPVDRTNAEDHVPLGIEIEQRILGWSYNPANGFTIVEVEVTNINEAVDLLDVHIGLYAELASGFKGRYEEWPPGGAWFDQKVLAFDPERRMVLEHHVTFDGGQASQYGAMSILGTRPISLDLLQPSFRWWQWAPGDASRDQDVERYAQLATPGFDDPSGILLEDDPAELLGVGPFPLLGPGESATAVFAFIGANDPVDAAAKHDWAAEAFRRDYVVPLPPPSPRLFVDPRPNGVTLRWDASPEAVEDPATGVLDFEGYRIYLSRGETDDSGIIWFPIAEVDLPNEIGFNTGLDHVREEFVGEDHRRYDYRFDVDALKDGHKYSLSVTSFDTGDPETASLESGLSQNRTAIVPGADADATASLDVKVFPNPYRGRASWDGPTERERVIWFIHLPPRAQIRIYTLGGDWVQTVDFNRQTYHGANTAGVYDPGIGEDRPELAGGMAAWNLLSWNNQAIATGLYLFTVRDLDTGRGQTGKFMVLK